MIGVPEAVDRAIEWSHAYQPPPLAPLVLPDHWHPSDVQRAVELVGAVTYRGETITSKKDIRGLEGLR